MFIEQILHTYQEDDDGVLYWNLQVLVHERISFWLSAHLQILVGTCPGRTLEQVELLITDN